jgi:Phosphatidylinositol 3- and 4-kinase
VIISGIVASELLDSSGEVMRVKGADISSLNDGTGFLNYEHQSAEKNGTELVGRFLSAKKIYGEKDCSNEVELHFWKESRVPFIFGTARLFTEGEHEGALALAAIIRDCILNNESVFLGFSVEGSTIKKDGPELLETVCRGAAITAKPCNKGAKLLMISDPTGKAKSEFGSADVASLVTAQKSEKIQDPMHMRLGGHEMSYGVEVLKAMTAGNYNVAPNQLSGGAVFQKEDLVKKKAWAVYKSWDGKKNFKSFLKMEMPEVSDEFLDHFADMVDRHSIRMKKSEEVLQNLAKAGKKPAKIKKEKEPHAEVPGMMIQGKEVPPPPKGTRESSFNPETGTLVTRQGSFQASAPSAPHPHLAEHTKLTPQQVSQAFDDEMTAQRVHHQRAMKNWFGVNDKFTKGALEPGVVSHAVAFAMMSPGIPVPIQETMYSIDQDVILETGDGQRKKISEFVAGDFIGSVDDSGRLVYTEVVGLHDHGVLEGFEVEFDDGYAIICSKNHKFLTHRGQIPVKFIVEDNLGILSYAEFKNKAFALRAEPTLCEGAQDPSEGLFGWKNEGRVASMAYSDAPLSSTGDLVLRKIVRIRSVGPRHMYDLEVAHPKHNFLLLNGVVTSNSHLVDALHSQGVSAPTKENWGAVQKDWMARNKTGLPEHSREHFKALEDQIKSKAGTFIGFNKPNVFSEYFGDYLQNHHDQMMQAIRDSKGDAHVVARKLTDVRGIAPKLSRYLLGMMGAGNMVVPDTHFIRHYFGGRPDAPGQRPGTSPDSEAMNHLKGSVLGSVNAHDILEGIDKHYFKNHDAVKRVLNDPTIGPYFKGREEQSLFPAFWWHWISIPGHENRIGIPNKYASNEGTDHAPFWDAVNPLLNKSEEAEYDPDLPFRSAMQHHRWLENYGPTHALGLYYRYLVPQLQANDAKRGEFAMRKFEELQVELLAALSKAEPKAKNPDIVEWQGKKIQAGHASFLTDPHDEKRGNAGKEIKFRVLDSDATHHTLVPAAKFPNFTPEDIIKLPRGGGKVPLIVDQPPTDLSVKSKVVSAKQHGVPEYLNTPEAEALAEGFDFGARRTGSEKGSRSDHSFWSKTPSGQKVYVKRDPAYYSHPANFPEVRQEGVFSNLAKTFFGLGHYVPTVATVRHPTTGLEHAIIAHAPGQEYDKKNPEHRELIKHLGDSGELDKMAVMDAVMGSADRHKENYLVDPKTKRLSLIDHNIVLQHNDQPILEPQYLTDYNGSQGGEWSDQYLRSPMPPSAVDWAKKLSPDELEAQLRRHGVPDESVQAAGFRLRSLQDRLNKSPLVSRSDVIWGHIDPKIREQHNYVLNSHG